MDVNVICGMNAVSALFARRPDDVLRLFFLPARKAETGAFCAALARLRRPYRMVEGDELTTVAGTGHHGGIAAVAKPREVPIFDRAKPPRERLLLVLDGVGNPHNLGAIARSAAFFGVRALLLGEGLGHAMLSNAAYRTAEGGVEFLDVFRTRDLPGTLAALDPFYRTVVATLHADAAPIGDLPRDRPIALVLGAEETGASPDVIAACRRQVRIAGSGRVQSLNVAQAAAVLLHSLTS
jgi:TrmH RNA methyltransferase